MLPFDKRSEPVERWVAHRMARLNINDMPADTDAQKRVLSMLKFSVQHSFFARNGPSSDYPNTYYPCGESTTEGNRSFILNVPADRPRLHLYEVWQSNFTEPWTTLDECDQPESPLASLHHTHESLTKDLEPGQTLHRKRQLFTLPAVLAIDLHRRSGFPFKNHRIMCPLVFYTTGPPFNAWFSRHVQSSDVDVGYALMGLVLANPMDDGTLDVSGWVRRIEAPDMWLRLPECETPHDTEFARNIRPMARTGQCYDRIVHGTIPLSLVYIAIFDPPKEPPPAPPPAPPPEPSFDKRVKSVMAHMNGVEAAVEKAKANRRAQVEREVARALHARAYSPIHHELLTEMPCLRDAEGNARRWKRERSQQKCWGCGLLGHPRDLRSCSCWRCDVRVENGLGRARYHGRACQRADIERHANDSTYREVSRAR